METLLEERERNKEREDILKSFSANPQTKILQTAFSPKNYQLPKFSGSEGMKWEQWWPLFSDTVHEQEDLDDRVKCLALHGLLQGQALELCFTSLPVNAESYKIVIKRLHDHYGKPELLMAGLLQESTDFAKQLDENNHTSLLSFQSKLQDLRIQEAGNLPNFLCPANNTFRIGSFPTSAMVSKTG